MRLAHFSETPLARAAMPERRTAAPSAAVVAGYVLAYVALDWISYIDPVGAFAITPWNPPPGLSLAFLLRYGVRQGGWLFVAALAADIVVRGAPAPLPVLVAASLLLAVGYTALAALLTQVLRVRPDLVSLRDTAVFVVACALACGVIAFAFVSLFAGSGLLPVQEFGSGIVQFWIGDLIGIVVTTPALLVATRTRERPSFAPASAALAEALAIALALWIVFGARFGDEPKLFYVLFLPVIWIAMRHGIEGSVFAALAVQLGLIAAIVVTRRGAGAVLDFQFVMLVIADSGWFSSCASAEASSLAPASRRLRSSFSCLSRNCRSIDRRSDTAAPRRRPVAATASITNWKSSTAPAPRRVTTIAAMRPSCTASAPNTLPSMPWRIAIQMTGRNST